MSYIKNNFPKMFIKEITFMTSSDLIFMEADSYAELKLYARTSGGLILDISSHAMGTAWTINDEAILECTDDGLIHALKDGTTYITAEYKGLKAYMAVNVGNELRTPEIITTGFDNCTLYQRYDAKLDSLGTASIKWQILEGNLPPGLDFSPEGYIYGYPSQTGTFIFTVEVSNIAGCDTKQLSVAIDDANITNPELVTSALPSGVSNLSYSAELEANGGGLTWEITGLPQGLYFSSGLISGVPLESGTFNVKIIITNRAGRLEKTLELFIIKQ